MTNSWLPHAAPHPHHHHHQQQQQQQQEHDGDVQAISEEDFLARVAAFERNEALEAARARETMRRLVRAQSKRRPKALTSVKNVTNVTNVAKGQGGGRMTGATRTIAPIQCQPPPPNTIHPCQSSRPLQDAYRDRFVLNKHGDNGRDGNSNDDHNSKPFLLIPAANRGSRLSEPLLPLDAALPHVYGYPPSSHAKPSTNRTPPARGFAHPTDPSGTVRLDAGLRPHSDLTACPRLSSPSKPLPNLKPQPVDDRTVHVDSSSSTNPVRRTRSPSSAGAPPTPLAAVPVYQHLQPRPPLAPRLSPPSTIAKATSSCKLSIVPAALRSTATHFIPGIHAHARPRPRPRPSSRARVHAHPPPPPTNSLCALHSSSPSSLVAPGGAQLKPFVSVRANGQGKR